MRARGLIGIVAVALAATVGCASMAERGGQVASAGKLGEWITWGGDAEQTRYSALDQINAGNVGRLEVAWTWKGQPLPNRPDFNWKATPIYVNGTLYVPTGGSKVAALDPETGETRWMFTPDPVRVGTRPFSGSSRAVSYWTDGTKKRILHNSIDGRLFSIDADTGQLDPAFGAGGMVDLKKELLAADDPRKVSDLGSTGPGIVVGDVIVVQVITEDGPANKEQIPGNLRGYDIRTGKRLWTFNTIPRPGEFGHDTWKDDSWKYTGNASVWSMMSADPELGYVYAPIESPTNNFWGGQRPGDGLFGESIVCIDAKTGKRVWHFQVLHHGVWDYDLPAAPILHDIVKDGKTIKAVTLLTKQGMNFVFDRKTGKPVWPIEERPVPTSMAVEGEQLSPTQPFPTRPAAYTNLGYNEDDLLNFSPAHRAAAKAVADQYVQGPMYTPPTQAGPGIKTKGTLIFPNFGGGSNWNGGAVDKETNMLFVPIRSTHMAVGLSPADPAKTDWRYRVAGGEGGWLKTADGLPITRPPWAEVVATDMNRGEHVWRKPIGGAPDWIRNHPSVKGLKLDFDNMGQISVRPSPLVTKTLLFLAESSNIGGDPGGPMFRAYDKRSGKVVAELTLPGKTSGAPMTYLHKGRQYIAVALSEQGRPARLVTLALPTPGAPPGAPAGQHGQARRAGVRACAHARRPGRTKGGDHPGPAGHGSADLRPVLRRLPRGAGSGRGRLGPARTGRAGRHQADGRARRARDAALRRRAERRADRRRQPLRPG